MKKYIIDVTQLVHWQGRLTGIPRVVQELAVRFPGGVDGEVIFASWVKELGDMCEVDLMATLKIRGNGIEYMKSHGNDVSNETITGSSLPVSPLSSFKSSSKQFAKKVLRKTRLDRLEAIQKLRQQRYENDLQSYNRVTVSNNDVFFIGAGEWWDDNFIGLIESYKSSGVKIVQVSHDLLPIVTPQFAGHATDSLSTYNARVMPISDVVLAVSNSTKKDAEAWLKSQNLETPPIKVFRVGEDFTAAAPRRPTDKKFIETSLTGQDYILCVGTIEARKNHAILYYTYKLAKSRGIELPKLLIVGRRGWKTDDMYEYMTTDPETKESLIPLHDISDEELSWLYDNCLFTVYPSFYEGWGMPIAESIMRGAPCLASNTSSMIEVAPGFAEYFTPASTDELLDGIIKMLNPEVLAHKKTQLAEYAPTSWDDSFEQVKKYVENL